MTPQEIEKDQRLKQERRDKWLAERGYIGPLKRFSSWERRRLRVVREKLKAGERRRKKNLDKKAAAHAERVSKLLRILALRQSGFTVRQIAEAFKCSHQNIAAFVKYHGTKEEKVEFFVTKNRSKKATWVEGSCASCAKQIRFYKRNPRKYCDRVCFLKATKKFASAQERLNTYNAHKRKLWRSDPKYRASVTQKLLDNYHKIRHSQAFIDKQKIYTKRYQERLRFGKALTPLIPTKQRQSKPTVSIYDLFDPEAPSEDQSSQTMP